ncbi:MAG TPA: VOC family protein [Aggregatilineaceae bacterium]|nr:VOC family protein [Aggregatilineaceae bacterium]
MQSPILELRIAVTTADYDHLVSFYRDGLGLDPAQLWTDDASRALIFEMGRATLEVFNEPHAAMVDQLEVGQRVSGPIRFALRVPDLDAALKRVLAWGATLVHAPVTTPWGHVNARVQSPDGLQITLFYVPEGEQEF